MQSVRRSNDQRAHKKMPESARRFTRAYQQKTDPVVRPKAHTGNDVSPSIFGKVITEMLKT